MNNETISQVMREMALRRAAKLSPERRKEIAASGGKAGKGSKKPRKHPIDEGIEIHHP